MNRRTSWWKLVVESGHSRFPVIGEDRDQILGILLAKDLLRLQTAGEEPFEIREYMRPVVFVPESKRLNVLLKEFRLSHNHIAMVVDEYGGVCGLVTIEDVIEQIVGEIDDEHDVEDDQTIRRESEREFTVRALTPIADFNEYFGTAFSDEEYDTIGGLLMQEFGRLPRRGETIQIGELEFRVLRADRRRIDLLARHHPLRHRAAGRRRVDSLKDAARGAAASQWQALARLVAAFAVGGALNLAFAPFAWWPIAMLAPAALFALIRGLPPRRALWIGAAFGAGLVRVRHLLAVHLPAYFRPGAGLAHAGAAGGAGCADVGVSGSALLSGQPLLAQTRGDARLAGSAGLVGFAGMAARLGARAVFRGCRWAMPSSIRRSRDGRRCSASTA